MASGCAGTCRGQAEQSGSESSHSLALTAELGFAGSSVGVKCSTQMVLQVTLMEETPLLCNCTYCLWEQPVSGTVQ